ncbi:hypothetical protein [Sorangium cellulosum]|uniref:Uncharacterized protein n=1 Tax=Sorangium cellulosum TaxID=56 RepID=A0A150QBJ7_SORCE|nr:hypothetical protein [Sorangium cellulosum]KYF65320.1 hypothetical protein BE15_14055 [Sorangium cellulosum]
MSAGSGAERAARRRLSRGASGLRHLRWAREVLATLEAHVEHNPSLADAYREALRGEAGALAASVQALSGAVKPYRDFLERTRVRYRGRVRVAEHLVREADADGAGGAAEAARERLGEALTALAGMEETQRRPLKEAVSAEIDRLREAMAQMDARLEERVSAALVESLYPPLTDGASRVADDGDPDDDATASPR